MCIHTLTCIPEQRALFIILSRASQVKAFLEDEAAVAAAVRSGEAALQAAAAARRGAAQAQAAPFVEEATTELRQEPSAASHVRRSKP